ncbi:MAG: hypothetical protein H6954_00380 [Chromatiaceae bacterium]|nr:hypothetical protein [Chromatiaceae bacterium]
MSTFSTACVNTSRRNTTPFRACRNRCVVAIVLLGAMSCALGDLGLHRDLWGHFGSYLARDNVVYPNCGGSTSDATPVDLTWAFDRDRPFADGAPLVVVNPSDTSRQVMVTVRYKGPTGVLSRRLGPLDVAAGGHAKVRIDTDGVQDLDADTLTPIGVVVSADVDGTVVWAPRRFVQWLPGRGAYLWSSEETAPRVYRKVVDRLLYRYGLRLTRAERGLTDTLQVVAPARALQTPEDTASSASGIDPRAFRMVARRGIGGPPVPGQPPGEGSPPPAAQTLCFRLGTDFSTGGVDFADAAYHEARGAKVWLSVPFVGTFFGVTSRANGCVNIPALPAGFPFFAGMYFESHVGASDDRDIMVRTFDRPDSPWSRANWNGSPWDVPRNAYLVFSSGAGTVTPLTTHPNNWRMANLLAVGSEELAFYDELLSDGAAFSHSVEFQADGCPDYGENVSCAWDDEGWITNHDGGPHKAELIGHEFGHIVDSVYTSHHLTADYGIHDGTPGCDSYGEAHALNSKEHQSAAALEGIASALGAYALSASSTWRYYKSIPESDGLYTNQVIDLENAADFDYLEATCACPPSDCTSLWGVESDWIRFYWDYWPSSGVDMATFLQRHSDAANLAGDDDAYEQLRLQTPAGLSRTFFEARGALHGVDGSP